MYDVFLCVGLRVYYYFFGKNISGLNRVVIRLPEHMQLDDVLADMVEEGFMNGKEEHDMKEGLCVIKRRSEDEAKELVKYLNKKYGYISDLAYVKPEPKNLMEETCIVGARTQHLAIVQHPTAKNPNDQFQAYRRVMDAETGFPTFQKVDIENVIS